MVLFRLLTFLTSDRLQLPHPHTQWRRAIDQAEDVSCKRRQWYESLSTNGARYLLTRIVSISPSSTNVLAIQIHERVKNLDTVYRPAIFRTYADCIPTLSTERLVGSRHGTERQKKQVTSGHMDYGDVFANFR
jgi:hypothetical protein